MPAGPVLLSGYSYGSAIASAVIAQLPPRVRGDVALLTLACPVRRLYGRASRLFRGDQLATLAEMLDADGRAGADGRWKNLCRQGDYIGSWVLHDPEPRSDPAGPPRTRSPPMTSAYPHTLTPIIAQHRLGPLTLPGGDIRGEAGGSEAVALFADGAPPGGCAAAAWG